MLVLIQVATVKILIIIVIVKGLWASSSSLLYGPYAACQIWDPVPGTSHLEAVLHKGPPECELTAPSFQNPLTWPKQR